MKKRWSTLLVLVLWIAAGGTLVQAQEQTVGLFLNDERAFEGYTLIAAHQHPSTYLINNEGLVVNSWEHEFNVGTSTYLLPNGNLLRASRSPEPWSSGGGRGGRIEEIAWDGEIVWQFDFVDSLYTLHHDINKLPNGNVLTTVWELRSFEELIERGHDPATLTDSLYWTEKLIEFRPILPDSAEIVWVWDAWDHMIQDFDSTKANFGVVSEHPELVDINTGDGGDWLHVNAINYNPGLDQIVLSISFFSEFWIIDHSTTTEEAAGHTGGRIEKGGDIIYRWGNPAMYKAGGPDDRQLFFNHHAVWIELGLPGAGNLMIFDNGRDRPDSTYSTVYELLLPLLDEDYEGLVGYMMEPDGSFRSAEVVWSYSNPGVFYSNFLSGQQRLPNGHTLIDEGMTGRVFEVTPDGEKVWEYVNPVVRAGRLAQGDSIPPFSPGNVRQQNTLFRAYRYGVDYPAFDGKDLTPRGTIEIATAIEGEEDIPTDFALAQNYPNPFNPTTAISFSVPRPSAVTLTIYNMLGQRVATLADNKRYGQGRYVVPFDGSGLSSGVYFYRLESDGFTETKTMLLLK